MKRFGRSFSIFYQVLLYVFLTWSKPCTGLTISGSYRGSATWHFIEKFCFLPRKAGDERGAIQGSFYFPVDNHPSPSMMLYFKGEDENASEKKEWGAWEKAYLQPRTCEEKHEIADSNGMVFNMLLRNTFRKYLYKPSTGSVQEYHFVTKDMYYPVSATEGDPAPSNVLDRFGNETEYWRVDVLATMNTVRPRWFFVTVGNCEPNCNSQFCSNSINMQWDLTLTNGESHFSADQSFTLEVTLMLLAVAVVVNVASIRIRFALSKIRKFHSSISLLCWSIHCLLVQFSCEYLYLAHFGNTGLEAVWLWSTAKVFEGLGEFLLLLHVILVAKGWTIVRRKISAVGRIKVATFLTLYACNYFACIVYFATFVDKGVITYLYDTPPGVILTLSRVATFAWFSYSVHVTLKKYNQKRGFYRKYWFFISLWLLSLPLFVLVNSAIDIWARAKVMVLLQGIARVLVLSILIGLYNPSPLCGVATNASFPFHATTIGMLRSRGTKLAQQSKGFNSKAKEDEFLDFHLQRATDLSQNVQHAVSVIQNHTSELFAFLDELQHERQKAQGALDLEKGISQEQRHGLKKGMPATEAGETNDESATANPLLTSIPMKRPAIHRPSSNTKPPTSTSTPKPSTEVPSREQLDAKKKLTRESGSMKKVVKRESSVKKIRETTAQDRRRPSTQQQASQRKSNNEELNQNPDSEDEDMVITKRTTRRNTGSKTPRTLNETSDRSRKMSSGSEHSPSNAPARRPSTASNQRRRSRQSEASPQPRRPSTSERRPSTSGRRPSSAARRRSSQKKKTPSAVENSDEDDALL